MSHECSGKLGLVNDNDTSAAPHNEITKTTAIGNVQDVVGLSDTIAPTFEGEPSTNATHDFAHNDVVSDIRSEEPLAAAQSNNEVHNVSTKSHLDGLGIDETNAL